MSLRGQIRDAVDEVSPPAPDLERKVRAYVLADNRERKVLRVRSWRSPWANRFHGAGAVVAALLVIVLLAGLVVGGRFLRGLQSSPVPAINQADLQKLEARPLLALPAMPADGVCPVGPLGTDFIGGPAIGNGAVRSVIGGTPNVYNTNWGTWNATWFLIQPGEKGLFIVRARDLRSGASAFFAGNVSGVEDANMGRAILGGKAEGQDRVNGQVVPLRPELVMNASAPSDFAKSNKAPGWGAYVGYPTGSTGCIFFQVDYAASTETFVRAY